MTVDHSFPVLRWASLLPGILPGFRAQMRVSGDMQIISTRCGGEG